MSCPQNVRWVSALMMAAVALVPGCSRKSTQSPDPAERIKAVEKLEQDKTPDAVQAIAPLVRDLDVKVACRAVLALGRTQRAEAVAHIKAAATDARPEVREAAAHAMGELREQADVPVLLDTVRNAVENENVRAAAAKSLGRLDVWDAMPTLLDAMADPSAKVRGQAYAAVRMIMQRDFGFRAEGPDAERQRIINRIRKEYPSMEARHADYVRRMKGRSL